MGGAGAKKIQGKGGSMSGVRPRLSRALMCTQKAVASIRIKVHSITQGRLKHRGSFGEIDIESAAV